MLFTTVSTLSRPKRAEFCSSAMDFSASCRSPATFTMELTMLS